MPPGDLVALDSNMKAWKRLDLACFAILTSNLRFINQLLLLKVDEDEFPIHLTEELPSDISWVNWGANREVSIDSSDVGRHSLVFISVVPESAGKDVTGGNLPVIVPSSIDIPKMQSLFQGCDALASKVLQESSCNDKKTSGSSDSLRTSKACEFRKDNGAVPHFTDAEVANQRRNGQSLTHLANPESTPQIWAASVDLGPSSEAQPQPTLSKDEGTLSGLADHRHNGQFFSHSANPKRSSQNWVASAEFVGSSSKAQFPPSVSKDEDTCSGPVEGPRDTLLAEDKSYSTPALSLPKPPGQSPVARAQSRRSKKKSMDEILQLRLSKRCIGMVSNHKNLGRLQGTKGNRGNDKGVALLGNQLETYNSKIGTGCYRLP
ncbi:hypothetical protein Ancab_016377 [Ancistrocladus abbreviatus]